MSFRKHNNYGPHRFGKGPGGYNGDNNCRGCGFNLDGIRSRLQIKRAPDGMIMGICKGLARKMHVSTFWVRLGVFLLAMMTGFIPVLIIYVIVGLVMEVDTSSIGSQTSYQQTAGDPQDQATGGANAESADPREANMQKLKDKFESLENRLRNIEDVVTSKDYDWERRMKSD